MDDVLVGIDGSVGSVAALRWAAWFTQRTKGRLHVANAWQHGPNLAGPPERAEAPGAAGIEAAVEVELDRIVRQEVHDPGIVAGCRALRGTPAHALAGEAARVEARLLVVGARGAGGALRHLLGSVSRELTECPAQAVAVVPDHAVEPPGPDWRVVVGVDGSTAAARAVRWAARTARAGDAEVVAVHALEPPVADVSPREQASLVAEAALRLEEEWCAPLRTAEVLHRAVVLPGPAAEAIHRTTEQERPACVVVGSRGLGPISQRLLGSVTHALVRELDVTTVIVPSPRDCVVWAP